MYLIVFCTLFIVSILLIFLNGFLNANDDKDEKQYDEKQEKIKDKCLKNKGTTRDNINECSDGYYTNKDLNGDHVVENFDNDSFSDFANSDVVNYSNNRNIYKKLKKLLNFNKVKESMTNLQNYRESETCPSSCKAPTWITGNCKKKIISEEKDGNTKHYRMCPQFCDGGIDSDCKGLDTQCHVCGSTKVEVVKDKNDMFVSKNQAPIKKLSNDWKNYWKDNGKINFSDPIWQENDVVITHQAPLDNTLKQNVKTVVDKTVVDKTVVDKTVVGKTVVDKTVVGKTVVDKTALDNNALVKPESSKENVNMTKTSVEEEKVIFEQIDKITKFGNKNRLYYPGFSSKLDKKSYQQIGKTKLQSAAKKSGLTIPDIDLIQYETIGLLQYEIYKIIKRESNKKLTEENKKNIKIYNYHINIVLNEIFYDNQNHNFHTSEWSHNNNVLLFPKGVFVDEKFPKYTTKQLIMVGKHLVVENISVFNQVHGNIQPYHYYVIGKLRMRINILEDKDFKTDRELGLLNKYKTYLNKIFDILKKGGTLSKYNLDKTINDISDINYSELDKHVGYLPFKSNDPNYVPFGNDNNPFDYAGEPKQYNSLLNLF